MVRSPKRTQGSWLHQSEVEHLAVSDAFNVLCHLSTIPFAGGGTTLYGVDYVLEARHRLLNIDSFTSTPLCISNIEENINLLSPDGNYADVFKPELRLSPESSAKHGVQHYIKTTGPPVLSKYRRLRPELLQVAKDAFMEMEKMGVCSQAATCKEDKTSM